MTVTDLVAWGIDRGYHDYRQQWHDAPERTIVAIMRSMGVEVPEPPPGPPLWFTRPGQHISLGGRWELHAEDGGTQWVSGTLPDLPLGYHDLFGEDGRRVRLVVTPGRCALDESMRRWGWAAQLYATRSQQSWGMGDLADLGRLTRWSRDLGAGFVLVNPLHASAPVTPQEPSPYYPSSRCFLNPLYIRVEDAPGAAALGDVLADAAAAGRALNGDRRVDRDAVLRLKLPVLEQAFDRSRRDLRFDAFVVERGERLHEFALYCALAETFGPDWRRWPGGFRHPASFECREFASEHLDRLRFHMWLQWVADRQLHAATRDGAAVVHDLAVGADPGGADAWIWQDVFAPDMTVGAPPDEYNRHGQDWAFPPFDPWKLRASAYEPLVAMLRAALRHAGGLRIDHVMGLFRLFWIPEGSSPTAGTYVRYPASDMLDILALESHRAGAYVVGEDLGTVEPSMREELQERNVLSYRLVWFEPEPPESFPRRAMAAVTTHDLPTIAGLWSGADLEAQRERGVQPNVESTEALLGRLRSWTGLAASDPVEVVIARVHELLARAPSMLLTASLDDAVAATERPNHPGTTGGINWSLALACSLDELEHSSVPREIASVLGGQ